MPSWSTSLPSTWPGRTKVRTLILANNWAMAWYNSQHANPVCGRGPVPGPRVGLDENQRRTSYQVRQSVRSQLRRDLPNASRLRRRSFVENVCSTPAGPALWVKSRAVILKTSVKRPIFLLLNFDVRVRDFSVDLDCWGDAERMVHALRIAGPAARRSCIADHQREF